MSQLVTILNSHLGAGMHQPFVYKQNTEEEKNHNNFIGALPFAEPSPVKEM